MKLLSVSSDAKTVKGEKQGYLTGILYLAPANTSGTNVCAMATDGCKRGCLAFSGRSAIFPAIMEARIRKTRELFADRQAFIAQLRKDIAALVRKATRENLIPCVRINGTSDLPWLALTLAREFTAVQFYDYTKLPGAHTRTLPNYHLTFSHSESNEQECVNELSHGINCAVVFAVKRGHVLPTHWHGFEVLDGDLSDLRFLDESGKVIGLRAKGTKAKNDCSGFVVSPLVQIGQAIR
jgi:hypothetical protein